MGLNTILAISGRPGLFKLLTQTRGGFVAKSLLDNKKISVNAQNNVSVLSEIAVYTLTEELPLKEVLKKIRDKENGGLTSVAHKASKDDLEEYFFSVLSDYDEDRVYASDIKKIIQWYNLLHKNELLNLIDEEEVSGEDDSSES